MLSWLFQVEHAGCGHGDSAFSVLGVIMVVSFKLAGCGHGNFTLSMLGMVMVIPL